MSVHPVCEFPGDELLVRVETSFPGVPSAISPTVETIMRVVGEMDCAQGSEHEIELALREALANAVRHGCCNDPSKLVHCTVACDRARGMLIVVRDSGPGFDPSRVPNPLVGQQVYSHHGRGIYLISQLMDEVRFENGGTEIHMVKRRHPS